MTSYSLPAQRRAAASNRLPITPDLFRRLEAELDRLTAALRDREATVWQEPIIGDPTSSASAPFGKLQHLEHRLDALRHGLRAVEIVEPDGTVVVGSRVTVREDDGSEVTYLLVLPSVADPRAGSISHESPLGAALLGRPAGAVVTVAAPAGPRDVTIVHID